jgi:hypothetical protein
MGDNVIPIFFTLVGVSEGYLQAGGDASVTRKTGVPARALVRPRFAHVMA